MNAHIQGNALTTECKVVHMVWNFSKCSEDRVFDSNRLGSREKCCFSPRHEGHKRIVCHFDSFVRETTAAYLVSKSEFFAHPKCRLTARSLYFSQNCGIFTRYDGCFFDKARYTTMIRSRIPSTRKEPSHVHLVSCHSFGFRYRAIRPGRFSEHKIHSPRLGHSEHGVSERASRRDATDDAV